MVGEQRLVLEVFQLVLHFNESKSSPNQNYFRRQIIIYSTLNQFIDPIFFIDNIYEENIVPILKKMTVVLKRMDIHTKLTVKSRYLMLVFPAVNSPSKANYPQFYLAREKVRSILSLYCNCSSPINKHKQNSSEREVSCVDSDPLRKFMLHYLKRGVGDWVLEVIS